MFSDPFYVSEWYFFSPKDKGIGNGVKGGLQSQRNMQVLS
jgi:hypothetical protein